ncbi:MAG: PIN domain-containing protein [Ignavibacteriae bacterium]|nr:PIN domain-containing protein [Ignavibacteriota bacterium]
MNEIFFDTNLLIYAIDEESKYYISVQQILNNKENKLFTSSKNISEFLSVVTRNPKSSISIKEALVVVKDFQKIFTILYPTEKSNSIFIDLLKKYSPIGLRIHDFEIISISLSNNIKTIATVNKKDFIDVSEIELVLI